jgi:hypothetical protein
VLKYWVPHGSQPRPGWAPDPLMVGIRSPIGLVVGSCTSHPGVLGSILNERNQGKQAHPVLKYRVPHGSQVGATNLPLLRGGGGGGVQACTRRQSAAGDGVPTSLQIPPHTRILLARAPDSPFRRARPFSNGIFRSNGAPASLPPP